MVEHHTLIWSLCSWSSLRSVGDQNKNYEDLLLEVFLYLRFDFIGDIRLGRWILVIKGVHKLSNFSEVLLDFWLSTCS